VAFTPSPEYGERNRQQTTTIGKYLPKLYTLTQLPDHVLRDLATKTVRKRMEITTDTTEWYRVLKEGPTSCMSVRSMWPSFEEHPYRVYDPDLGWSMAVRYADDGAPLGRALVFKNKYFVRTFLRHVDWPNGYSYTDETLQVWLQEQGMKKLDSWCDAPEEVRISIISSDDSIVAPYLDGSWQHVDEEGVMIDGDCEADYYICGSTSCYSSGLQSLEPHECSHCGRRHSRRTYENDGVYVGRYGDDWVGPCCIDDFVEVNDPSNRTDTYLHPENDTFTLVDDNCLYEDSSWVHRRLHTVLVGCGPQDGNYALQANCVRDTEGNWWYAGEGYSPAEDHPELFNTV